MDVFPTKDGHLTGHLLGDDRQFQRLRVEFLLSITFFLATSMILSIYSRGSHFGFIRFTQGLILECTLLELNGVQNVITKVGIEK